MLTWVHPKYKIPVYARYVPCKPGTKKDANGKACPDKGGDKSCKCADADRLKICDCSNCNCKDTPTPAILANIWKNEATKASAAWMPAGEHMPQCEGGCPDSTKGTRRVQFTSDIRAIVQEIVDQSGWKEDNALSILIDDHQGRFDGKPSLRSYESYDGTHSDVHEWTAKESGYAPTLFLNYCVPVAAMPEPGELATESAAHTAALPLAVLTVPLVLAASAI